jgi:aminoglycoside phosphotransferase (APT) family kinase protein
VKDRIGEGREGEILDWGQGRVLKLAWKAERQAALDREEVALRAASAAGAPVPRVYERVTVEGRPGLVMERLNGPDLLTRLGSRPWTLHSAARLLGALHARLHGVRVPDAVPSLKDNIRDLLRRRADRVPAGLAAEAIDTLDELPDGDRLCHGDYHPGNVLLTTAGPRVIDWPAGSRGDPAADVCRSRLLVQMGALPERAPLLIRRLDLLGRAWLLRTYVRAYGGPDMGNSGRWARVITIARLAEGIDSERTTLLERLGRAEG